MLDFNMPNAIVPVRDAAKGVWEGCTHFVETVSLETQFIDKEGTHAQKVAISKCRKVDRSSYASSKIPKIELRDLGK